MPRKCTICTHPKMNEIDRCLIDGIPYRYIAEQYDTSIGTLERHKKHLSKQLLKAQGLEDAEYSDSLLEQMRKINENANILLDTAMTSNEEQGSNPNIAIMAMKEIRGQLALQLDIFKIMYDLRSVKDFQQEIINLLGELDPKIKEQFIKRIKEIRGIQ